MNAVHAFGADILEVGYAIRGQVDAAAHIALWDTFSRNGTFLLSSILDDVVGSGDIELLAATLELSACVAADLGDGLRAARLAGAAEEHPGEGRHADCTARRGPARAVPGPDARATIPREVRDAELAAGRALSQQQAVTLVVQPVLNS
jgi:hypothetical protein